ncbi:hypothetical protein PQX77_007941 [Marasmius sp. AFHP31]|nr:hypothetical protein PQX77_007941 [Marasmius sp. AFHP31]
MVEKHKTKSTVTSTTTTRTKTVVVTESPSQSVPKAPRYPSPPDDSNTYSDNNDPNNDAIIQFATDSEEESSPPTSTSRATSVYVTTRSEIPRQPSSSPDMVHRPAAEPERPTNDDQVAAFYEARYPGQVPFPGKLDNACLRGFPIYYVVTAG